MKGRIRDFVSEMLMDEASRETLTDDLNLLMGGIDSMGIMRLVSFIEEEWQVKVPPEDVTIDNFMNINVIANYIQAKRDADV